jgi:formamidase
MLALPAKRSKTLSRLFGVAGVQMGPVPWDVASSVQRIESLARRVRALFPWVDMIVFPELAPMGLDAANPPPEGWEYGQVAETVPGPLTERFCCLARELDRWLLPGSIYERDGETLYNTALVASPEGELVAHYRKMFPWRPLETTSAGQGFCVFDVPGVGRFGISICYDMWFPEHARSLAWLGAEVVLHPSATYTSDRGLEVVLSQANAIMNQCYLVDVNACGHGARGLSLIVDPEGRVLQQAGEQEGFLTEMLDLDRVSWAREYGTLALNALWRQLRDTPVRFPPYGAGLVPNPWIEALGTSRNQPALAPEQVPPCAGPTGEDGPPERREEGHIRA